MFFHCNLRLYLKKLIHKKFNKKIRIKLKENKKRSWGTALL
jgi:small nuclear ribonucleoprotein (snRNP)-like protein